MIQRMDRRTVGSRNREVAQKIKKEENKYI